MLAFFSYLSTIALFLSNSSFLSLQSMIQLTK
ncbi:hypothetical protein VCHENC02_3266, partial [Vibrio harveyi]